MLKALSSLSAVLVLSACGQAASVSNAASQDQNAAQPKLPMTLLCVESSESVVAPDVFPLQVTIGVDGNATAQLSDITMSGSYMTGKHPDQTRLAGYDWYDVTFSLRAISIELHLSKGAGGRAFGFAEIAKYQAGGPVEVTAFLSCNVVALAD